MFVGSSEVPTVELALMFIMIAGVPEQDFGSYESQRQLSSFILLFSLDCDNILSGFPLTWHSYLEAYLVLIYVI